MIFGTYILICEISHINPFSGGCPYINLVPYSELSDGLCKLILIGDVMCWQVYPRSIYAFGLVAWTGNDVLNRRYDSMCFDFFEARHH